MIVDEEGKKEQKHFDETISLLKVNAEEYQEKERKLKSVSIMKMR